jgi:hypothetical protein
MDIFLHFCKIEPYNPPRYCPFGHPAAFAFEADKTAAKHCFRKYVSTIFVSYTDADHIAASLLHLNFPLPNFSHVCIMFSCLLEKLLESCFLIAIFYSCKYSRFTWTETQTGLTILLHTVISSTSNSSKLHDKLVDK